MGVVSVLYLELCGAYSTLHHRLVAKVGVASVLYLELCGAYSTLPCYQSGWSVGVVNV